jgi:DNA-binding beta-propeller fold protein YncE
MLEKLSMRKPFRFRWALVPLLFCSLCQPGIAGVIDTTRTEFVDLQLPQDWYLGEVVGLEFSAKGDLVVFNRGLHPLLIFDKNGNFKHEIGLGLFKVPHGLMVDDNDHIWTTDQETHQVLKFDSSGQIQLILGRKNSPGEGWFENGYQLNLLKAPSDVALDSEGNIYVADGGNFRIVKYDEHGNHLSNWGSKGESPGLFNFPHSMLIDVNYLIYVTDRQNARIQIFDTQGIFQGEWTEIGYPYELERYDEKTFILTDARSGEIIKIGLDGKVLERFGKWGKNESEFGFPHGLAIDNEGFVFVGELLNWRIQKYK